MAKIRKKILRYSKKGYVSDKDLGVYKANLTEWGDNGYKNISLKSL